MSKEQAKILLTHLKEYVEETTATQDKAVQALVAAGILKSNGELKEIYQG